METNAFNPFEEYDDSTDLRERLRRNVRWLGAIAAAGVLFAAASLGTERYLSHEMHAQPPVPTLSGNQHQKAQEIAQFYMNSDH
jgi:hypothetical protein